jgi:hypothetical protein
VTSEQSKILWYDFRCRIEEISIERQRFMTASSNVFALSSANLFDMHASKPKIATSADARSVLSCEDNVKRKVSCSVSQLLEIDQRKVALLLFAFHVVGERGMGCHKRQTTLKLRRRCAAI